jgi:acetyl esterase/lipase
MKMYLLASLLMFSSLIFAQNYMEQKVWLAGAPESNGIVAEEEITPTGQALNSKEAKVYIYFPEQKKSKMTAVLICPGGGYSRQAMNHEGHDVAKWLASKGIVGVVLKYRLPNGHSEIPLHDAQEAMRLIRRQSSEWGVDSSKVGVCGFSAGGHLASTLGTHYDRSSRPDFKVDQYSNEGKVTAGVPPTLLILSDDDKAVIPQNSIDFYSALKRVGVPASMYIFPVGGHGFGFNTWFQYHGQMKQLLELWLNSKMVQK